MPGWERCAGGQEEDGLRIQTCAQAEEYTATSIQVQVRALQRNQLRTAGLTHSETTPRDGRGQDGKKEVQPNHKANLQKKQSSTMPSSVLLCCLAFLAGVGASLKQDTPSENSCTHFPASLPHMLRELRAAFSRVKTFFQMKDQLDNMLLSSSLLEDFKGYLGCQALSEMIQFYLKDVMPLAENHSPDINEHVNSLGEKLKTLRLRLRRCKGGVGLSAPQELWAEAGIQDERGLFFLLPACPPSAVDTGASVINTFSFHPQQRFLPCENRSQAVEQVKTAFSKLQEKGVYKAMSEFDIFINYIEAYMTMRMKN
ncbi:hypothetical protein MC885_009495 [Smutsia gigantea]|nr:hypothetical protein MC885_009495 [Smutsia gigantea]